MAYEKITEGAIVVDVREEYEYKIDHWPGALHASIGELEDEFLGRSIPVDQAIVLYCDLGIRAVRAFEILEARGYRNIFIGGSLEGLRFVRAINATPDDE